jgi:hypothetical protein
MKHLLIILSIIVFGCKVQHPLDNDTMQELTIKGLENIRQDYLRQLKFKKAHEIKLTINQYKK